MKAIHDAGDAVLKKGEPMRSVHNVGDTVLIRATIVTTNISVVGDKTKVTYLINPVGGEDACGYRADCFFIDESHIIEEGDAHGNL